MSELSSTLSNSRRNRIGVKRMVKKAISIDLTPMVDLGFLLITFFIYTTSLSQPKSKNLVMPDDSKRISMPVSKDGVLTLLPGRNGQVFYYEGLLDKNIHKSQVALIRQVILNKRKSVPPNKFFIIIKPSFQSTYKDLIEVLDEMEINDVKRYAIAEINNMEQELMK